MNSAIHEMRDRLSVAMAGVEALRDRTLEPNDLRLNAVFGALREVDLLIDDLPCEATAQFRLTIVAIDVCPLVARSVGAMEGFASERGVRLTGEACALMHCACKPFLGDPLRIAEIVTNVIMNAIRCSPVGGEVRVDYRRDRSSVILSVSDEGPGVAFSERERIFELGYRGRGHSFPPGSGIGLALVKQFVDRQGGSVEVTDGPLCGATFTIQLPGTLPAARRSSDGRAPRCQPLRAHRKRRAL